MNAAWWKQSAWPRGAAGPALAGALLAVAAVGAEFAWVAPVRAEREALAAVAAPGARAAAMQAAPASPATQLAQFHAAFPPLDELAGALGGLDAAARHAGVALRTGEYRIDQRAGAEAGALVRYRVALRTSGDYAQIRAFIGRALEQWHYVALDDVQFRRSADAAAPLDADLRLSIYLRQR